MTRVSVIVVNYNAGERIVRNVDCLANQTFRDFDLAIVDNASTDGSGVAALARAKARGLAVRLIEPGSNLGFAAANNRAAGDASGRWLAFLNPDAYPEPDWLERLLAAADAHPWAEAFGSTQIDAAKPDRLDGAGDVFHVLGIPYRGGFGAPVASLPPTAEVFAPCAAAALYKKERFVALGGFDERFFCYGEDVDLGFRLRLAGGRCLQVADARVHHEGSGVTGRYSPFTVYHGNRNRIWLTYKNVPGVFYWPLAPVRLLADAYLLTRAFTTGMGWTYFRALRDGYAGLGALRVDRRRIQAGRRASLADIARAVAWSPHLVSTRAARIVHGGPLVTPC